MSWCWLDVGVEVSHQPLAGPTTKEYRGRRDDECSLRQLDPEDSREVLSNGGSGSLELKNKIGARKIWVLSEVAGSWRTCPGLQDEKRWREMSPQTHPWNNPCSFIPPIWRLPFLECSLPFPLANTLVLQKPVLERLSDLPEVLSSLYTQRAGHIARAQEAVACCWTPWGIRKHLLLTGTERALRQLIFFSFLGTKQGTFRVLRLQSRWPLVRYKVSWVRASWSL